jgi:hypothetical protein
LATKQLSQSFLCTDIQIAIQTFSKKCLKPKIPFFGGYSEEVTPVPIPNTEVKLFSADGTAREAWWESRTPPKILYKACHPKDDRLFYRRFHRECGDTPFYIWRKADDFALVKKHKITVDKAARKK